jgi:hypothetical protein
MFHLLDLACVAAVAVWAYKHSATVKADLAALEASVAAKVKAEVSALAPSVQAEIAKVEAAAKAAVKL